MAKNHVIDHQKAKPVGIWLRVSTEDQAKGDSPQHHEKRARYYAEAKGWEVKEVYHLEGVSGKTVIEHPEAKRMMSDIKHGRITGLIFSKIARLARNTRELLDFSDFFRDAGADLISLQEAIDTSTPAGRLFYTLNSAMATWEREEIASRVAASVPIRAKMGKSLGGRAPFGYQWKDKQFITNPDEVPVAKLMFELFIEHKRIGTVARVLNGKGLRTRVGAEWSDTTVGRLLQDPTFKGRHRLNYTTRDEKSWIIKPETDWEYIDVEPIVSAEVWDRCNAVLGAKEKRPRAKRAVHLFAGLVFCACGEKMYVLSNSPKYTCQACRNKLPADDLEAVYVEQLKGFFTSSEQISSHLDKANESLVEKGELLAVKRKELEKVQKEIDRVYRLYVDEQLTGDDFKGFFKPLQDRKKSLEEETARAEAELDFLKVNRMSADEIVSEAGTLYGRWPKLSREERRSVIEGITEKITIGKGNDGTIEIELAYVPTQSS
jgi:site-specific DNA recombinase